MRSTVRTDHANNGGNGYNKHGDMSKSSKYRATLPKQAKWEGSRPARAHQHSSTRQVESQRARGQDLTTGRPRSVQSPSLDVGSPKQGGCEAAGRRPAKELSARKSASHPNSPGSGWAPFSGTGYTSLREHEQYRSSAKSGAKIRH